MSPVGWGERNANPNTLLFHDDKMRLISLRSSSHANAIISFPNVGVRRLTSICNLRFVSEVRGEAKRIIIYGN